MSLCLYAMFAVVGSSASMIDMICGIGRGVLIKPILDAFSVLDVTPISFLSGCTVLSMSYCSASKAKPSEGFLVDLKTGTPLAIGATIGGVTGGMMSRVLSSISSGKDKVGATQAVCLLFIAFGIMLYVLKEDKIYTHHMTNPLACTLIDLMLDICSSLLGTGGGPISLVVLFFFFSMDTKMTVQNSLYIIPFSQITNLINTLMTGIVPQFGFIPLAPTVACGILGDITGRTVNKKVNARIVDKPFVKLMVIIILICVCNVYQFM